MPAQLRVLRRHSDRTAVFMTFAHHDTAKTDQNRRSESELLRTQQSADHHVASGLQLSVHLKPHPVAQLIEH